MALAGRTQKDEGFECSSCKKDLVAAFENTRYDNFLKCPRCGQGYSIEKIYGEQAEKYGEYIINPVDSETFPRKGYIFGEDNEPKTKSKTERIKEWARFFIG